MRCELFAHRVSYAMQLSESARFSALCALKHYARSAKKRASSFIDWAFDLVFVKYNRALRRRYELRNFIDPILLNEIDDSNEWLIGKVDGESNEEDDDFVFSKEDGLTYRDVAKASGAGEPRYNSSQIPPAETKKGKNNIESSSKGRLIDESEDEEDEIEFDETDTNPYHDSQDEDFENLQEEPDEDDGF
ncbi:hypothetical protein OROMI_023011 [Orobanche minor]